MKTYEYTEMEPSRYATRDTLLWELNRMGEDGWELVHFGDVTLIFKREITPEEQDRRAMLAADERWRRYRNHLQEDHEFILYVGDAVGIHREKFPDCEFGIIGENS